MSGRDRTELDQRFHKAIVSAAHNEFLVQLLPIINSSVSETIALRSEADTIAADTLRDHAMLMSSSPTGTPPVSRMRWSFTSSTL